MTNAEKLTLAKHACHIRMGVIEGTHSAKCGHPGGSLDIAEVLSYLYFVEMNVDPKAPKAPDRDRLVLSKGHAAPGLYAALAERGFFPVEDLKTLRKIGSYLQGHPNMNSVPGVDMSTGSLGQGISAAGGKAEGVQLQRHHHQRPRLRPDRSRHQGLPRRDRKAHLHRDGYPQGQGRFLYGERR